MLTSFVRDSSYFQIVRNSNQLITGALLDTQFSNLINYINNKIVPLINNLASAQIAGQLDSPGYVLRNIGDGSVQFSRIRNSDLSPEIIKLDKLYPITPNSITYGTNIGLNSLTSEVTYYSLINQNNTLDFQGITSDCVSPAGITTDKIGLNTLTAAHISPGVLLNLNIITGDMILDGTLTNYNLSDACITYYKMTQTLIDTRVADNQLILMRQNVTNLPGDTHIIKNFQIALNSINYADLFQGNISIWSAANVPNNIEIPNNAQGLPFSPYLFFNQFNPLTYVYITDNSFSPRNNGIPADGINRNKLSPALLTALQQRGGL